MQDAGDFKTRLVTFYSQNLTQLVRANLRLGTREEVEDAVQYVFLKIYERFVVEGEPEPQNLNAFFRTAIRNRLLDIIRGEKTKPVEPMPEEPDTLPIDPGTVIDPDDVHGWKQLFHKIFEALPPKYHEIAMKLMVGEELGELGPNAYKIRAKIREHICGALAELAKRGDPLARQAGRSFCRGSAAFA
jgi:RNA polymerase sigma factor (sigma-70 family)